MAKEKPFPPSAQKLRKARLEGDVSKSRDLSAVISLITGFGILFFFTSNYRALVDLFAHLIGHVRDFHTNNMIVYAVVASRVVFRVLCPVLIGIFTTVVLVEALQTGIVFSLKPLAPKMSRLNLLEGIQRIFGFRGKGEEGSVPTGLLYEIAKMLLILSALGALVAASLIYFVGTAVEGSFEQPADIVLFGYYASLSVVSACLVFLTAWAMVDFLLARKRRKKRLSMDIEEFRRDLRENEGDQQLRGMRKQQHQELLLHGLIQGVRRARVVIMNRLT